MNAASERLPRLATASAGGHAARADGSGAATRSFPICNGGGYSTGASSANSSVSPVSIARGVRDATRDRESSGARRTDSGARGSDGVLISGSSSPGRREQRKRFDPGPDIWRRGRRGRRLGWDEPDVPDRYIVSGGRLLSDRFGWLDLRRRQQREVIPAVLAAITSLETQVVALRAFHRDCSAQRRRLAP